MSLRRREDVSRRNTGERSGPGPLAGALVRAHGPTRGALVAATCAWLIAALPLAEAENPQPFFRIRDEKLTYTGPEEDVAHESEVRIGWFGPYGSSNKPVLDPWHAAVMALEEANAQGGLGGLPFRFLPRWTADPWRAGASQLTRMVYTDRPLAILGSVDSASTHLAEQIVAKAQLALVSPLVTDKSVTLAGVSWAFACAPSDDTIARVLANDILAVLDRQSGRAWTVSSGGHLSSFDGEPGPERDERRGPANPGVQLALLTGTDHESRMMAKEVVKELVLRKRPPGFRFEAPPAAAAIAAQVKALVDANPSAILIVATPEDAARLLLALRDGISAVSAPAWDPVIFGAPSMGRARFLELAGRAADGVRFPLLAVPESHHGGREFVGRFTARFQRAPDYAAVLTYDATRLLIEAIRASGQNRALLREQLHALSPWSGIAGTVRFDGTGQNMRTNLVIGTIREGRIAHSTLP